MGRRQRKSYVDFFRGGFYYRLYAPMGYFERTEEQAEFIVEALGLLPGAAILDLCCGQDHGFDSARMIVLAEKEHLA